MSLKLKISEDLKHAMKEKNAIKLSVLRVFKGEIERNEQGPNGKVELSDGDIIKLGKKLVEGIKETSKNQDEIDTLNVYLPQQLNELELKAIVLANKELGLTNLGEFMKFFKTNYDGLYDGKLLSTIVKNNL